MAVAQTDLVPVSFSEINAEELNASDSRVLDAELLAIANEVRTANTLAPLGADEGLAAVARAHARDMALRGYVGYADPSGISLLDQVRMTYRTALIGSFGSSIAVLDAKATPAEIHAAIQSDPANAENLRRGFDRAGIGSFESEGRLYVVQLFARIAGELSKPLPMQLTEATLLEPSLVSNSMTPVGWSLSNENGELLARGGGRRILSSRTEPVAGFLNLDVAVGNDVYTLRGPYVQVK
ncbi:MAG: CAP domain-containing protein [Hyphomonas sp.]